MDTEIEEMKTEVAPAPEAPNLCVMARPGQPPCGKLATTWPGHPEPRCKDHFFSDFRLLGDLPFGVDSPPDERDWVTKRVRGFLGLAGVEVGDDIDTLGCTGLWSKLAALVQSGTPLLAPMVDAVFVRKNIGGCNHGLPCFVGPDRYCLIHDTIGALQPGQKQLFADAVPDISRELTDEERKRMGVIENIRRGDPEDAIVKLRELERGEKTPPPEVDADDDPVVGQAPAFKCTEHATVQWGCRFCVAEQVAAGAYTPKFLVLPVAVGRSESLDEIFEVPVSEVGEWAKKGDLSAVGLFVQVGRWVRKLVWETP